MVFSPLHYFISVTCNSSLESKLVKAHYNCVQKLYYIDTTMKMYFITLLLEDKKYETI